MSPRISPSRIILFPSELTTLVFLHLAFAAFRSYHVLYSLYSRFLSHSTNSISHLSSQEVLKRDLEDKRWKKTPDTLGVLFVPSQGWLGRETRENEVQRLLKDVRDLVGWCRVLGVRELSTYDERGLLQDNSEAIKAILSADHPIQPLKKGEGYFTSFKIRFPTRSSPLPEKRTVREIDSGCAVSENGEASTSSSTLDSSAENHSLRINILSRQSGKPHIAHIAESLSTSNILWTDSSIHEAIESKGFTEPELLIILGGPYLRLYGFPPWQVRLTEMYHYPAPSWLPPPRMTVRVLREALDLFGGAQFRLGR